MMRLELGLLFVRFILGVIFFMHGFVKYANGLGNTASSFETMGLPSTLAYIVTNIELVGGAAMILGIGIRFVAALFAIVMIGAIITVKLSVGFMGNGATTGYEYNLILLAVSVLLTISDSKLLSLDQLLSRNNKPTIHDKTKLD